MQRGSRNSASKAGGGEEDATPAQSEGAHRQAHQRGHHEGGEGRNSPAVLYYHTSNALTVLLLLQVRNDRIREQEEERRIRAHMRKKELSEKEASAVLQTIISEVNTPERRLYCTI